MIFKRLLWIFPLIFLLLACDRSEPVLLPTPAATATLAATPTCYVVIDMTSSAMYPVEFVPTPASHVYYVGQKVKTAVTGGVIKWSKLQICGNLQKYVDDFERTIRIQLADQTLVEFVCEEETCPVAFTIPPEIPRGSTKMIVHSGATTVEYDILIQAPGTPYP